MKHERNWNIILFNLLFFVFTAIVLIIVYKDIDFPYAVPLLMAYAVYLTMILVYFLGATLWKARYLSKKESVKRLRTFVGYFSLFLLVSLGVDMVIKDGPLSLYSLIPIPFGLAFGLSFFDLIFKDVRNKGS